MAGFIKPVPNHWKPEDFDLTSVQLEPSLAHITKTICLLESRCDDYAVYLQAIFKTREPAWKEAIGQWNHEECQHGVVLKQVSEAIDQRFAFEELMQRYASLVTYHAPTGVSVRGSVGAELVSRCVVETLASTLYRVLADATADTTLRKVYSALAQDEARHYGMFLKMLNAEALSVRGLGWLKRVYFALKRMLELEDAQIMFASCLVAGRASGKIRRKREANWYLAQLYALYRWGHLRYAAKMLLRTVHLPVTGLTIFPCTFGLWAGVRQRLWLAKTANWLFPATLG